MIDLNPIEQYQGKAYSFEEAQKIQDKLVATMPTSTDLWYWRNINTGSEVVWGKCRKKKEAKENQPNE